MSVVKEVQWFKEDLGGEGLEEPSWSMSWDVEGMERGRIV